MELFITRREIRRRILARLGFTTNDSQAPLVLEPLNEEIRAAANAVYLRCPWQQAMRETTVSVGIDQRFINYPTNAGPGEIQAIGLWDDGAQIYRPLQRRRIPVVLDDEPLVEEGDESQRGRPDRYEAKAQIEIWPRPDQAYRLKIDHTISPDLADDAQVCVVDAELIILKVMVERFEAQGEMDRADRKRQEFEERLRLLIGDQATREPIQRGAYDRLALGRRDQGYVPDSGVWPSRMPS